MYYINLRWKESDFPLEEFTKKHLENNVKRDPVDHRLTVLMSLTNQISNQGGEVCDCENFDGDNMELEYRLNLTEDDYGDAVQDLIFAIWKITECYFPIIFWGKIVKKEYLPNKTFDERDYDDFASEHQEAVQPSV